MVNIEYIKAKTIKGPPYGCDEWKCLCKHNENIISQLIKGLMQ